MTRRPIDFEPGAIRPVPPDPWATSAHQLEVAADAIDRMDAARQRHAYEMAWSACVDALEQAWVHCYGEAQRRGGRLAPWAGRIVHERRRDPLLRYLIEARHQSQHGGVLLDWNAEQLIIGRGFAGRLYGLHIHRDRTFDADSMPVTPGAPDLAVTSRGLEPRLPTIANRRSGERFEPPRSHRGQDLAEVTPRVVAMHGLSYCQDTLRRARELSG